ncbi:MAG: hypothetical protein PHV37_02535 [Candidatus Gastranaerophilales bacterium]|nr:hypothetical protein [Candidatus Gastranaerophilales bacterium]
MSVNYSNNQQYNYPVNMQGYDLNQLSPQTQASIQKAGTAVKETAQDSFVGSMLSSFGVDTKNPKKAIISILGALGVVFGLSGVLNKAIKNGNFFKLTNKIDDFLANNKVAKSIGEGFKNFADNNRAVKGIKNFFENSSLTKFLKDKKNLVTPKLQLVKQTLRGTKGEVLDTATDTLRAMLKEQDVYSALQKLTKGKVDATAVEKLLSDIKSSPLKKADKSKIFEALRGLTEKGLTKDGKSVIEEVLKSNDGKTEILSSTLKKLTKSDNVDDLVDAVRKIAADDSSKFDNFEKIYSEITKSFRGKDGKIKDVNKFLEAFGENSEFAKIIQQTEGGFMAGQKVNLAEAIKKYAILNGDTATTKAGQKLQQISLRGIEAMSNGVASKTAMGYLMGLYIYNGVMNKTQDAPKGERVSTFADEAVSDMGSYMMLPLAGGLMYKAASLKNWGIKPQNIESLAKAAKDALSAATPEAKQAYKSALKAAKKDGNILQKLVRKTASVLAVGLEKNPLKGNFANKLRGIGGGTLRFIVMMFAISPMLMKPVMKLCHRLFGTPTEVKNEEAKKKAEKQGKSTIDTTPANASKDGSTNYLDMMTNKQANAQNTSINNAPTPAQKQNNSPVQPQGAQNLSQDAIDAKKIKKEDDKSQSKQSISGQRVYVPSTEPTQFPDVQEDTSSLDALFAKADSLEKSVMKNL